MRGGMGHFKGAIDDPNRKRFTHWDIFKKCVPYLWPEGEWWQRIQLLISFVFLVASNVIDLASPILLKYSVNDLSGPHPILPWGWILAYGLVKYGSNAFSQFRDLFFAEVSANTEKAIALETFRHLQSLSLSFHLKRETGSIIRATSRGSQSFAMLTRIALFQILPIFLQIGIVVVYLATQFAWYFPVLTFGIMVLYFSFTLRTTTWRDEIRREMSKADNEYNQRATDALIGFETIKYFNGEKHEERRFGESLSKYTKANIKSQQSLALLNSGQSFIISIGIAVTMYLSAREVVSGNQSVGDFVLLNQFILQLYVPLNFLGTYYRMIKQSLIDVESMFDLLGQQQDIKDHPDAVEANITHGEIRFENVTFSYDNKVPILKGISLTIECGKRIAIVGSSGSGKSTLLRLIYRFYDVTSGKIYIDGQDVQTVTQESLRRHVAIVPQDTVLFNDTLYYNISYGAFGKGLTQEQVKREDVIAAAKKAEIYDFVMRQPTGFDTKVGERGLRLSGGEKQRVSIARAILKNPKLWIFDEATSALDSTTEQAIMKSIWQVSTGATSIQIAHRLSTIKNCDKIIVMAHGVIVEEGTHTDLLAIKDGHYKKMYEMQERTEQLRLSLTHAEEEEIAHLDELKQKAILTMSPSIHSDEINAKHQQESVPELAIEVTEDEKDSNSNLLGSPLGRFPSQEIEQQNPGIDGNQIVPKKKTGRKSKTASRRNSQIVIRLTDENQELTQPFLEDQDKSPTASP